MTYYALMTYYLLGTSRGYYRPKNQLDFYKKFTEFDKKYACNIGHEVEFLYFVFL